MRPTELSEHGELVHRVDDEVARHQADPDGVRVADGRHDSHGELPAQECGQEVGAVVLLRLPGAGVADDDAGAVDGGRQAVRHRLADQQLGLELGALVVVAEGLALVEPVLGELALEYRPLT